MTAPSIQHYVALGDSLSEGISDWGRGNRALGFATVLATAVRTASPEVRFTNLGMGGARVADVLRQQLEPAIKLQPDLVTLVVGANDLPATPMADFQRDYNQWLKTDQTQLSQRDHQ